MTVGDTIIIPIAVRMFVITRSTTMKGRYSITPISKARVSSAVTKAGARMKMSRSVGTTAVEPCISSAADRKKARSCGVVKRVRKSRTGSSPWRRSSGQREGSGRLVIVPPSVMAEKDAAMTGDMT